MILDFFCIMLSLIIKLINNDKVTTNLEKQIIKRYLNLYEEDNPKSNTIYSVLNDKEAIKKVFQQES